jgi:hypothetical protein
MPLRVPSCHYPAGFVLAAAIACLAVGALAACGGCGGPQKPSTALLPGDAGLCTTIAMLPDGGLALVPCDFSSKGP